MAYKLWTFGKSTLTLQRPIPKSELGSSYFKVGNEQNVRWPPKIRAPLREISKWLASPKDIGYKMKDCRHFIEDLLYNGYLGDHVRNNNNGTGHQPQGEVLRLLVFLGNRVDSCKEDYIRTIHSIRRELGLNVASNNVQERYEQEIRGAFYNYSLHEGSSSPSIIFTSNDEASSLYEDPLEVILRVGLYDVCKILVGIGS